VCCQSLFFLDLLDDARWEGAEQLQIIFTSNIAGVPPQILPITIEDNDPLPLLNAAAQRLAEDGQEAAVAIPLTLDTPSDQTVRLAYRTEFDGEADARDIIPAEGVLEIAPGTIEAFIPLSIRQDTVFEGDESFSLVLFDVENARLTASRVQVTLTETQAPTLSLSAENAQEGQDLTFTLSLMPTSPRPLYFLYGPVGPDGSFLETPAFQLIEAGQSQVDLIVPTQDDAIDELDEPVVLGVQVTDDSPLLPDQRSIQGQGLILDDDPDPVVLVSALPLTEGQEGALILVLEGQTTKETDLHIRLDPASVAQVGVDLPPLDLRVRLSELSAKGATGLRIPFTPLDDTLNESREPFALLIEAPGVDVRQDRANLLVIDNDPLPTLMSGHLTLQEGEGARPSLRLDRPSGRDLLLSLTVHAATAQEGEDYVLGDLGLRIPEGEEEVILPLELLNDDLYEAEETLRIDIVRADFMALEQPSFAVTIADDDPLPSLNVRLLNAVEGQTGTLRLELDRISTVDAVARLSFQPESQALQGLDFDLSDQDVRVPAGVTEIDLPINFLADGIFEGTESLNIQLTAVRHVQVPAAPWRGTIADGDAPPALFITSRAVPENLREPFLLDIQAFGAFERPLTLSYELVGVDAVPGEDFVPAFGTIEIRPDNPEAVIEIQLLDDEVPEGSETFEVRLSSDQDLALPQRAPTVQIIDNEFFTSP